MISLAPPEIILECKYKGLHMRISSMSPKQTNKNITEGGRRIGQWVGHLKANQALILGTPFGPLNMPGLIPEHYQVSPPKK